MKITDSHKIVQQRHMALRVGCVDVGGVAGAKYACTSTSGLKFCKKKRKNKIKRKKCCN